ncbi:ubiquitin specific protease 14-like isoform 1 [Reticulomyxa filosa]|uniref:Ubiquitin carboxyl-terminal hydrolase n=1 Tax=Reticulomyxa filosa TaxID=46433 RepID=X6P7P9_RETFI|nr:ubiquitin specific protease 14-like isoform 1 [Reticulomyxa filosa]|eukprot:ETO34143.1 ubiquitin specific protease 14-like isoform 1 [Reticulomyxa filosa]
MCVIWVVYELWNLCSCAKKCVKNKPTTKKKKKKKKNKLVEVIIKHGKSKHKNVKIEDDETLEAFQAKVMSLTQVPPSRQKLVCKGKQLETNEDLRNGVKNKDIITLVGSAEKTDTTPMDVDKKVNFIEDMTEAQRQEAMAEIPPGLHNLGNTCYLNSTLQCLKGIPELKEELKKRATQTDQEDVVPGNPTFSVLLGRLFAEMDSTSESVVPRDFVDHFRNVFPEFATRTEQGHFQQQDSDECLTQTLTVLKREMTSKDISQGNWVDFCFGGVFDVNTMCQENADETAFETEPFVKLRCFIDQDTRHVNDGIAKDMTQEIEKRSNTLQRNALFKRTRRISQLPKYLNIQMVRFFWKQASQVNAKILRSVVFPEKLDIYDFCNDALKTKISDFRKAQVQKENEKREAEKLVQDEKNKEVKQDDEKKEKDKNKDKDNNKDTDNNKDKDKDKDKAMDVDPSSNESGYYELIGLVTHKGLSANSGHYIGYVKDPKRGWLKFDDEVVTEVSADDIKKLYGGGQWQMGYECFYRKI